MMGKLSTDSFNQSHLVRVWPPRAQVEKPGDACVGSLRGARRTYRISELPFLWCKFPLFNH